MKELGLLPREASHYFSLDDWEMKRELVVLNRKLGEGAFGTVYGGEAFIEGQGWVAVAVKTLKIGAIVEHKVRRLCTHTLGSQVPTSYHIFMCPSVHPSIHSLL